MFHIPMLMAGNLPKRDTWGRALATLGSFNYIVIYEIFALQKMLVVKYNFMIKACFLLIHLRNKQGCIIYSTWDAQMIATQCVFWVGERRLFSTPVGGVGINRKECSIPPIASPIISETASQ